MKRRSKLEIWLVVLWIINNGTSKPTRIMYKANLSSKPLQQILRSMVNKELVKEIDTRDTQKHDKRSKKRYEITQKGSNVLRYFIRSKDLMMLKEIPTILTPETVNQTRKLP